MNVPLGLRVFQQTLRAFDALVMSKSSETVFYAVGRGKQVGIYDTWKECKAQTEGVANAKYRKFYSYEDAEEFVNFWKNYSAPVKDSILSENSVSRTAGRDGSSGAGGRWTRTGAPFRKSKRGAPVLGREAATQGPESGGPLPVRPYTSPLSTLPNPNFVSFLNSKANGRPKIPSRTPNGSLSAGFPHTNEQKQRFRGRSKGDFEKSSSSVSTSPKGLSGGPEAFHILEPPVTSTERAVPSNGSAGENERSEACSGLPRDGHTEDVTFVGKKEVVELSCTDSGGGQSDGFDGNGRVTEVSDKLTLCLSLLGSVLNAITRQNTNVTEKTRNLVESLLGEKMTDVNTNTHVNPQMEPQGSVDMICEDTKNFDKLHPVGIEPPEVQGQSSSRPQSSPLPPATPQPSPSRFSSAEARADQRSADVLALNLRLDSFEKRFDACLREIGAMAAEISHIKSDIKDLKESAGSSASPRRGAASSPSKAKDGRVQTTLCFDLDSSKNASVRAFSGKGGEADSEAFGAKEGRSLKRKLSRSNSSEKSKRFAEDDIDDLLSRIKTEKVDYASFTLDEDEYVEVYTDGSAHSNGKGDAKAGIGIWFGDNHPLNVAEPVVGPPTNNTAEIQAARVAIQLAIKAGITRLKIHTDSEFLINCATKWIHRWKTNGWTLRDGGPVKNKKELEKLDKVASKISVRWEKVPAHSNIKGNETADRLANEGAARYER